MSQCNVHWRRVSVCVAMPPAVNAHALLSAQRIMAFSHTLYASCSDCRRAPVSRVVDRLETTVGSAHLCVVRAACCQLPALFCQSRIAPRRTRTPLDARCASLSIRVCRCLFFRSFSSTIYLTCIEFVGASRCSRQFAAPPNSRLSTLPTRVHIVVRAS